MQEKQMTTRVACITGAFCDKRGESGFYFARSARRGEGGVFLLSSSRGLRKMLRSPCLAHKAPVMQVNTRVTEGCSNCNL